MASLKDIIHIETNRSSDELNKIHLFMEGSFWRAYEWSAWLFMTFVTKYQITHRRSKGIEDSYILLGFPEPSLNKLANSGTNLEYVEEKHIVIKLSDALVSDSCGDLSFLDILQEYKQTIAIKEPAPSKESRKQIAPTETLERTSVSLSDVARRLLAFPLESKSPLDAMAFIAELKQEISTIF